MSLGIAAFELRDVAGSGGDLGFVHVIERAGVQLAGDVEIPAGVDELLEVVELDGTDGAEFVEVLGIEGLEFSGTVGWDEEGGRGEAMPARVLRRGDFAFFGLRAGAVLGVGAIGLDFEIRRHGRFSWRVEILRRGVPSIPGYEARWSTYGGLSCK